MLNDSILNKNENDLDLLLMLLEHFNIIKRFNLLLAELLIQLWHHFHDRIAGVLEFNASEGLIKFTNTFTMLLERGLTFSMK